MYLSMNIFKISNFYNFLLYTVKDINCQSCVLTYVYFGMEKISYLTYFSISNKYLRVLLN